MTDTRAVKYELEIADIIQGLVGAQGVVDAQAFDPKLNHLVKLRASQINGCAHCIKMHVKEARRDGETNDRLDRVIVWEHVHDFTEKEKAAFAWTEALTVLDRKADLGAIRARLRDHFTEREIGVLTSIIGMINLWNRMQVSRH